MKKIINKIKNLNIFEIEIWKMCYNILFKTNTKTLCYTDKYNSPGVYFSKRKNLEFKFNKEIVDDKLYMYQFLAEITYHKQFWEKHLKCKLTFNKEKRIFEVEYNEKY